MLGRVIKVTAVASAAGVMAWDGFSVAEEKSKDVWAFAVPPPLSTGVGGRPLNLRTVIVIMRHGDRTPLTPKLGSFEQTEEDTSYWASVLPSEIQTDALSMRFPVSCPTGERTLDARRNEHPNGQLTITGCREMEALGVELRKAYGDHMLSHQPSREPHAGAVPPVVVRSTNITRTIQSAQCLLCGLFPYGAGSPIPIHVRPWEEETMVPQFDDALEERIDELASRRTEAVSDLYYVKNAVKRMFNIRDGQVFEWSRLREILFCYMNHGRGLPVTSPLRLYEAVSEYVERIQRVKYSDPVYRDMCSGPFAAELADTVSSATRAAETPRMMVFSAHDSTVVPLLYYFGAESVRWPTYGTYLAIELYESDHDHDHDHDHRVRVVYNGQVVNLPDSDSLSTLPVASFNDLVRPKNL